MARVYQDVTGGVPRYQPRPKLFYRDRNRGERIAGQERKFSAAPPGGFSASYALRLRRKERGSAQGYSTTPPKAGVSAQDGYSVILFTGK
jgi:hypothetical protein